jgi:hypothetical protein
MINKKRLLVTFSGGETSAYMALWLNKYMSDEYEIVFVFANTGVEHNETLEFIHKCENQYGININWIESSVFHGQRKGTGFKIVDYNTATRNTDWLHRTDTPFEEVVKKYGIPNHSRLHCTRELKMNPIKNFAKSIWGKEKYHLALGIRVDEIDRVNPNREKLRIIYPLTSKDMNPMTKKQINFWWSQQDFRLNLKGYQGNCGACYKKSRNKLMKMAQDDENFFLFLEYIENKYGNPNGKIPQKIKITYDDFGIMKTKTKLETLDKSEYKNVFFRDFVSAREMLTLSTKFTGDVNDDSVETESCEVFTDCGNEN